MRNQLKDLHKINITNLVQQMTSIYIHVLVLTSTLVVTDSPQQAEEHPKETFQKFIIFETSHMSSLILFCNCLFG